MKKIILLSVSILGAILLFVSWQNPTQTTTKIEKLGRLLYFDEALSSPEGMGCVTCHDRSGGWAGPNSEVNATTAVYPGIHEPRFGNRKPPTASYAGDSPVLHIDEDGHFVGGLFVDGRATGWEIGDPLAEQAMGPFLNPLEQNLELKKDLVEKIIESDYAQLFREVFGESSLSLDVADKAFEQAAVAIAAFERSVELNPYNSRFDVFWWNAHKAGLDADRINEKNVTKYYSLGLTNAEINGMLLFEEKGECAECHPLKSNNGNPPLFTDFTYDNLGVPRNPKNPFYVQEKEFNSLGEKWVDEGLGAFLATTEKYKEYAGDNIGKYRVPTLRNVDMKESDSFVKAYMHNGFFTSLRDVVDFYNSRDLPEKNWGDPEIMANVNKDELGDLELTDEEIDLIVLFLQTLSDQ